MATNNEISQLLTDPDSIILETDTCIDNFKMALADLSTAAIRYSNSYDKYIFLNFYDADALKQRMKDTIMKAVSDERR